MGRRSTLIGAVSGIACALCVGLYMFQLDQAAELQRAEAFEKYGGEQVEVYVARRDLSPGEEVDEGSAEKRQWLAELLPEGAVTDLSLVRGMRLGSSILAGEVVLSGRFEAQTELLAVPDGMSALSVPAKDVQAVGGALSPGIQADVYMTGPSGSQLLVPGAAVLAVGGASSGAGGSWVTLAVQPALVQELVQAAQSYELYFVIPGNAEEDL